MFNQLIVLLWTTPVVAQFANPRGPEREVWTIGDVQSITYETEFSEYTIALWQKNPSKDTARQGPIIYSSGTEVSTDFDWRVQVYDFDLDDSDVYFFWMFEGDASMQGNMSSSRMASPYFQITPKLAPTSSPTTTLATLSTPSTLGDPSTPLTSTSTNGVDLQEAGGEGGAEEVDESFSSLPAGVQAGIGVGIAAVVATCIVWTFIVWLYFRRRRQTQAAAAAAANNAVAATVSAPGQHIPRHWNRQPKVKTRTERRNIAYQTTSPIELW